jgi:type IV pilus assembly protein PilQ
MRVTPDRPRLPMTSQLDELRDRLEQALLRRAARLLDVTADERGDDLAELVRELESTSPDAGADEADDLLELRRLFAEREDDLNKMRSSIGSLRQELDAARAQAQEAERRLAAEAAAAHEHQRRARDLQERLAEATLRRAPQEPGSDADRTRLELRESRLEKAERAAEARVRELDELESVMSTREARLDYREDELDRLKAELALREERLARREEEVAVYVGQVQEKLLDRRAS